MTDCYDHSRVHELCIIRYILIWYGDEKLVHSSGESPAIVRWLDDGRLVHLPSEHTYTTFPNPFHSLHNVILSEIIDDTDHHLVIGIVHADQNRVVDYINDRQEQRVVLHSLVEE